MDVCLKEWDVIANIKGDQNRMRFVESLCHKTKDHSPKYNFDEMFYKMPSYIRRAAIFEEIGKISSYKSNLANWEADPAGRKPRITTCGYVYPTLYRSNMYEQTGDYSASVKLYHNKTWEWVEVTLKKSDMDYIYRRCKGRKMCAPTLQKRGKEWFLDFPFEEKTKLTDSVGLVVGVDLGLNSACTCCVMDSYGTVYGRHFLDLPSEKDRLEHAINRIKKAQQNRNYKTPRLWAKAKGMNQDIASKTAAFIIEVAVLYNADTIVFEHLDLSGKKRGSKKQRLHLWKARYVQSMVTDKAHRLGMHIAHICAWNTSKLAFDGSGEVLRGKDADMPTYSICKFTSGKIYNCDLNASYNIAARYFIREILKSCSATDRLDVLAKVPKCSKRSTCTLSDLLDLNAAIAA